MGIPTRVAVAMSGLVFAGGAALVVGGATSASAEALAATPEQGTQQGVLASSCGNRRGCGCGSGCGCGGLRHHGNRHVNHHRSHSEVIVINRNNNISRSGGDDFDRHRGFRGLDRFRGLDGGGWGDRDRGWGDDDWND
ncbi:MAG TPA: hypothetical protein VGP70_23215 [Actinomadura sp.]|jgi:hypothetical protein|nr:hypothetical protein [Actinomadura sp.]